MVAVRDEGRTTIGQGSLIDNTAKAERIVEALIEAGVEADAVTALRATELPLTVSYRWRVELLERGDGQYNAPAPPTPAPTARSQTRLISRAGRLLEEVTPESPFQLRMDRVLWLGLWAASLFILATSLMASLSRGSAREFVVGSPSSSSERGLQTPDAVLDSNSKPEAAGLSAEEQVTACATTGPADCQCNDFVTQPEAQAFFERYPPASGHDVDPDRDGISCEWLPQSTPATR
jgi:hypothetical protein